MIQSQSVKGQVWSTDFLSGMGIFVSVLIFFLIQLDNNELGGQDHIALLDEAVDVSNTLMTRGSPSDWNNATVEILGLTNGDQRINTSKWNEAENMSQIQLLNVARVRNNFGAFLLDENDCMLGGAIGDIQVNATCPFNVTVDGSALVSVRRLVIYESEPAMLHVYSWS